MALVNPNIAMSFRQPEFQPRNALAEYAQVQQIMGGQRQAEVADMQLQRMRQEDAEIERIHQIAMRQGGPDNRMEMGRALFASRNPQQRELGYKILQHEEAKNAFNAAERQFGYAPATTGAAAPSAAAAAAGATAPGATPTFPIAGKDVRMGTLGTGTFDSARISDIGLAQPGLSRMSAAEKAELAASAGPGGIQSMRMPQGPYTGTESMIADIDHAPPEEQAAIERALPSMKIPGVSAGRVPPFSQLSRDLLSPETRNALSYGYAPASLAVPAAAPVTNTLAPAAAPVTNAMLAPAAQPAVPPADINQLAAAGAAPGGAALTGLGGKTLAQLQNEFRTYSRLDQQGAPGAKGRLEEIKREIDFIYKTNEPGAEQNMMRALGIPITEAGFAKFQRLKDNPSELTKLLDKLDLPAAQRRDFELRMAQKLVSHPPSAPVDVRVNAFVPASETAQAEYMKSTRTTFEALRNAQPTLDNIEKAKALVPGAKGFMGTGGEPLLAAASFLNNRLGTSINTTGVTDAQELRSRLFFGILDNLKKLDSQPSQQQQMALQQALGSIGTDPTALPRVLDAFGDSIRTKVDLYNADVTSAEDRGVKFPYRPQIRLTPRAPSPGETAAQIPTTAPATAIPQAAINDLKAGRGTDAQFDAIFGAGAAKRARGQ
jgi:hypothetical protein